MRTLITILLFSAAFLNSFGQQGIPKLTISHLTGDFYVFTTYHSLNGVPFPANAMYCVSDSGAVLFDTPWDTTQFQPLLDSIRIKHHKAVVLCIATHSHDDRTGGLEFLRQQGVKTYTTKMTDGISLGRNNKRAEFLFDSDSVFTVGQYHFLAYYPGPGHSRDNIVIWFDREKILYGGCLIKSTEASDLGYLADAHVGEWAKSIKRLQEKFKSPRFIIPGHQGWKNKKSLEHTLELLRQHAKNTAGHSQPSPVPNS